MKLIRLITFKGCQSTMDFKDRLEDLIEEGRLHANVEMVLVPSPEKAEDMGLYGSPTILVDEEEYQKEQRGIGGFY